MTAAAQWLNETFAGFDHALLEFFHKLNVGSLGWLFDPILEFVSFLGDDGICLIILSLFRTLYSLPLGKNQSPRSGLVTTVESPEDIRKKAENEACRIYIRKDMRY